MCRSIFVLFLLSLSMACHHEPSQQIDVREPPRHPAVHFLVLQDVSSSISGKVPRLDPEELGPVLDYAEQHGGTVGFISFGVGSSLSVRAVFDRPDVVRDDVHVNVFLRQAPPDPAERARIEDEYRAHSAAERERFLSDVAALLEESAGATNLVSGLTRAETFFSEVDDDRLRCLLVVSDFADTTRVDTFELRLDPGVRVLVVSDGIRDFGILQAQAGSFETFESVSAAIHAVVPRG